MIIIMIMIMTINDDDNNINITTNNSNVAVMYYACVCQYLSSICQSIYIVKLDFSCTCQM